MAEKIQDIMKQFAEALTKDIKKAIPVATGETRDSVNLKMTKTGFIIRGGSQIGAIIDGRKPSQKGSQPGKLKPQILKWIKAKGISPNEPNMSDETLAFLISRSIHKKGFKGRGNIFEGVITKKRIESLTLSLLDAKATEMTSKVIKEFNFK